MPRRKEPPKGFTHERNENTGAVIVWEPWPVAKYAVVDSRNHHHASFRDLDRARAFAASLPGTPHVPPEPRPVNISPRADPLLRAQLGAPPVAEPEGPRADEGPWPKQPLQVISRRGVYGVGEKPPMYRGSNR
jgi:hypothetical protein